MKFIVSTRGHYDFVNITERVAEAVRESGVRDGVAYVFCKHTTVGVTIMEWEEGIIKDLIKVWEKVVPEDADYEHHKRLVDKNGAAHVKSVFVGVDVSVPVQNGGLVLGTWQQIVLVDFDEKAREREVVVIVR